ncbi:MAG: TIR domain-containing protein, partial [Crocinitomicaceae bacterium]|nr:TIR domain-containing protein [Crocinitomicaceae bacterium]
LNDAIDSDDEDYIMRKIREDYLSDSTVTIHLIGAKNAENLGYDEQVFIKRELQASLYNGNGNTRSGILGVVLPHVQNEVYQGSISCTTCSGSHNSVRINNSTVVKEFSVNYYIPAENKCGWTDEDRYCVLVPWDKFIKDPNSFIDQAFDKRSHQVAGKVTVYPK